MPGVFLHLASWTGRLLALAAATTPWLALTWLLRKA